MYAGNVDRDLQLPGRLRRPRILEDFRQTLVGLYLHEFASRGWETLVGIDTRASNASVTCPST